jgi:phosphoribosylanthranilate isomerase
MFRVKICGITSAVDVQAACEAGADAIGINFYSGSPRYCTPGRAREIAAAAKPGTVLVGVFVNAAAEEIRRLAAEVPLDLVQLHGDETPEFIRELRPLPVMRVFRLQAEPEPLAGYLDACRRLNAWPRMALVDAMRAGEYGGTGKSLDWPLLAAQRPSWRGLPLVLAGGLRPDNVAQAIAEVRPWAVDVASGVEESPGRKSTSLVRQFIKAAQRAFADERV